jgi:sugar phosphate isomerase/epimerase
MAKPTLSWFPVSMMRKILVENLMTPGDLLLKAKDLGFKSIDIPYHLFSSEELAEIRKINKAIQDFGLKVALYVCSPDYTNPDPDTRRQQKTIMEMQLDNAHLMEAPIVQVTAGQNYPDVDLDEGIAWVADALMELQGFASNFRIRIAIENYLQDPFTWENTDFTAKADVFLKLYDEIEHSPINVSFNTATPIAMGDNPITVLRRIVKDVIHVHAADWSKGENDYAVAGEGDVPFDDIFTELAQAGFSGHIAVVEGPAMGEDEVLRSKEFLQGKIDRCWKE